MGLVGSCGVLHMAGGGSRFDLLGLRVFRSQHIRIRLVSADVYQGGNMLDVGVPQRLSAMVQSGHRQLNSTAVDRFGERFFIEVFEIVHAQLFKGDKHIAEQVVQHFDGGAIWCW